MKIIVYNCKVVAQVETNGAKQKTYCWVPSQLKRPIIASH